VLARDVMSPLAACLRETDTIDEATRFLLQSGISSTPVLDATGALAGFLSEKDLMVGMISPECWQRPLSSVMRPNVISYEEDTPIRVVYEFLCRVSIRGVVITRQGRAVGTISRSSLFRWFRDWVVSRKLPPPLVPSAALPGYSIIDTASGPDLHSPDNAQASPLAG
jgi:two-component system, cell cycle response regulator